MTRFDLANNYKIIIDTQRTINKDSASALKIAWDMCMLMGRQHGFSETICHEYWCKAIQNLGRDAEILGKDD